MSETIHKPDKQKMKELGDKFCDKIDSYTILLTGEEDGRLESLNSENEITNCLRKSFPNVTFLEKQTNREFGDIVVLLGDIKYPINIKMVDPVKSNTFNGGGPKTFNYVIFGGGNCSWPNLAMKIMTQDPQKCAKEYYYLIFYKNSSKKTAFYSLTDISIDSIVINPTNPIQLKMDITSVERTEYGKVEFMTYLARKCAKKRAKPHEIFIKAELQVVHQELRRLKKLEKEHMAYKAATEAVCGRNSAFAHELSNELSRTE